MLYVSKKEAENYSGDGYSSLEYSMTDPDINFAVIKINGRIPKNGFQVNTDCKEMLYILNGNGTMYLKNSEEEIHFVQGDVFLLDKNECYAFDGNFEVAVPCTPAWTSEQHKYID